MDIVEAKRALRKQALERRAAVPDAVRKAFADRLALEGVAIARRTRVRTVSAYWPMGEEADVSFLVHALAYHEFVAALPCSATGKTKKSEGSNDYRQKTKIDQSISHLWNVAEYICKQEARWGHYRAQPKCRV